MRMQNEMKQSIKERNKLLHLSNTLRAEMRQMREEASTKYHLPPAGTFLLFYWKDRSGIERKGKSATASKSVDSTPDAAVSQTKRKASAQGHFKTIDAQTRRAQLERSG
jgi:hypothetical protein